MNKINTANYYLGISLKNICIFSRFESNIFNNKSMRNIGSCRYRRLQISSMAISSPKKKKKINFNNLRELRKKLKELKVYLRNCFGLGLIMRAESSDLSCL